jgi:hypothetical protein
MDNTRPDAAASALAKGQCPARNSGGRPCFTSIISKSKPNRSSAGIAKDTILSRNASEPVCLASATSTMPRSFLSHSLSAMRTNSSHENSDARVGSFSGLRTLAHCAQTIAAVEMSRNYWGHILSYLCPTLKHLAASSLQNLVSRSASNMENLSLMHSFKGTALVSTCGSRGCS